MWSLDSPGKRAATLGLLVLVSVVLDLGVAAVVASHYNSPFGFAYADAVIASTGVFFIFYHWAHTLAYFALLIAYQLGQTTDSSKDLAAYVGGVLITAAILAAVNFIWHSKEKRGYLSVQDVIHDE
jgi:hypothetical protein